MKTRTDRKKRESGASAVEFALVLPLFILFLFGIVEFGVIFYDQAVITNASREGARIGSLFMDAPRLPYADIQTTVNRYTNNNLITFGTDRTVTTTTTPAAPQELAPGNLLTVRVSFNYDFLLLPNIVTTLTGPLTLRAETIMRAE